MSENRPFCLAGTKGKSIYLFSFFLVVVFIIYFPAAKAGFVGDVPYAFNAIKTESLFQYLNINVSLYQSALLQIFLLYKLFGVNPWLWYIIYITLHACNAFVLFKLSHRLLQDSKVTNAASIAFVTAVLFAVCPHASEPVVWKACNHYLVAVLSVFLIMLYVQKFHEVQKKWYAWLVAAVFLNASFSLEFFYLVPLFVLIFICYYRFVLHYEKPVAQKALLYFFIPILSIFLFRLLLLRIFRHTFFAYSHFGSLAQKALSISTYLYKPLKYLFHVIFLGRYFPLQTRQSIYRLCENTIVVALFYSLVVCFFGYVLLRFKKVSMRLKVMALVLVCILLIYGFVSPLSYPDSGLVFYDRYTYLANGFDYLFLALLVSSISFRMLKMVLLAGYTAINVCCTVRVNYYWKQSANIIDHLMSDFPDPGKKTVLLLNLPDDLNGIPMIAANDDGRFKIMLNALTSHCPKNEIYDVVAYNMSAKGDGAHVKVINDSVIDVTLNQWGTWWLYGMLGASSYKTKDYSLNMVDEGHWYELTLKHPADQYLLLYQVADKWKVVDWKKKNVEQY